MRKILPVALLSTLVAACGADTSAPVTEEGTALGARSEQAVSHAPVCPGPSREGDARCHARVVTDVKGNPHVSAGPTGLNPADLRAAYGLPSAGGAGQVFAIVDAYDHPTAESDLGVYRAQFGLPPCTTANGCFRKVNQDGMQGKYPHANQGWALEIALDLAMASASCPSCAILLVEAKTNSLANLGAAVNTAVRLGATVVSNSYGGSEYSRELADERTYFDHPGVAITASSGDSGYGVSFPAASRFVTAVGGTTLARDGSARGWRESAWNGAGSGCSAYVTKPSWQLDAACARRTVADVSAVADPSTGVSVYDSYGYQGQRGWFVVGGTSASAPLVAGVYALAGNASSLVYGSAPYATPAALFDVTAGSNGTCGGTYLCTGTTGYDGPTGLGTPDGVGAF
jgi:subtilase family serine protease